MTGISKSLPQNDGQLSFFSGSEERLALYAHLAQSMDDIKLGRVHSADDVFNDLISDLENLDV